MTSAVCVCTASSSASPKATAMKSPLLVCGLPCSSAGPTHGSSVRNSLRSCRLAHPEIPPSGPSSTVSSWRLTAAARKQNSSPENLTQLHYNLLGKDSREPDSRGRGGTHAFPAGLADPHHIFRVCHRLDTSEP